MRPFTQFIADLSDPYHASVLMELWEGKLKIETMAFRDSLTSFSQEERLAAGLFLSNGGTKLIRACLTAQR